MDEIPRKKCVVEGCNWTAPPGKDCCGYHYAVNEQREREIKDAKSAPVSD